MIYKKANVLFPPRSTPLPIYEAFGSQTQSNKKVLGSILSKKYQDLSKKIIKSNQKFNEALPDFSRQNNQDIVVTIRPSNVMKSI